MQFPGIVLDRSAPFAEVHGEGVRHSYEQNGLPFDFHGDLCEEDLTAEQKTRLAALPKPKKPKAEAKPVADEEAPAEPPEADDKDGVNLTAWLTGKVRYRPFAIFAAVKNRYGVNLHSLAACATFLVDDQKLVQRDQCKVNLD